MKITVETLVRAPIARVWEAWNSPQEIERWNTPSEGWHTTSSSVDLRVGGQFLSRMEAKDGTAGFDFGGTYTQVNPQRSLQYVLGDGREVDVEFLQHGDGVTVRNTFDAETQNPGEMQRAGWQAISDSFGRYVEEKA